MGVDVVHIIKNDYVDDGTRQTREAYCRKTIAHLRKVLSIKKEVELLYCVWEGAPDEVEFDLDDPFNVTFRLHQGFWEVNSWYHYCRIVMHFGGRFPVRDTSRTLALALGQNEVWHLEDSLLEGYVEPGVVCEDWDKFIERQFPEGIPEWSAQEWIDKYKERKGGLVYYDYSPIYHDNLAPYPHFEDVE